MPTARNELIERIRTLHVTIHNTEALRSRILTERQHNESARMLRNGLAVVGFASLEDFIKKRSSEILQAIGTSSVSFASLPPKLQAATTYEAISAFNHQLGIRDAADKISYIQEQALKVASTATSNYELTDHAFGYNQSNVNSETIKKTLLSFNVSNPWEQMSRLASRLGLIGLPLLESYRDAANRRHRAAHVATADTPENDIKQFVNDAIAVAISFDSLISKSLTKIQAMDSEFLSGSRKVTEASVSFRFLKYQSGKWKDLVESSNRAFRVYDDIEVARTESKSRAASSKQTYVEYDQQGLIIDWHCH